MKPQQLRVLLRDWGVSVVTNLPQIIINLTLFDKIFKEIIEKIIKYKLLLRLFNLKSLNIFLLPFNQLM